MPVIGGASKASHSFPGPRSVRLSASPFAASGPTAFTVLPKGGHCRPSNSQEGRMSPRNFARCFQTALCVADKSAVGTPVFTPACVTQPADVFARQFYYSVSNFIANISRTFLARDVFFFTPKIPVITSLLSSTQVSGMFHLQ